MNSDATSSEPNLLKLWHPKGYFQGPLIQNFGYLDTTYTSFGLFQNISRAYNGANSQPIQWKSWFHFQLFHWVSLSSTFLHPHIKKWHFWVTPSSSPQKWYNWMSTKKYGKGVLKKFIILYGAFQNVFFKWAWGSWKKPFLVYGGKFICLGL